MNRLLNRGWHTTRKASKLQNLTRISRLTTDPSTHHQQDFAGKVALVTGGSSGLGAAAALLLARRGARVAVCGRHEERLEASRKAVEAAGGGAEAIAVKGDLTQATARAAAVAAAVDRWGRLDVLIANASALKGGFNNSIETATEEIFDANFDIGVKAPFFLIQEALPHLKASKGCVVVTSSIGSTIASHDMAVRFMAVASLDHMVRCAALGLGRHGVRLNAVNPGAMPTRLCRGDGRSDEEIDAFNAAIMKSEVPHQPLGDALTVQAVAETMAWLASPAAAAVTGRCLPVDAGRCLVGSYVREI